MGSEEIEANMTKLLYSVQDLDLQISRLNISEIKISSARQLADLNEKKMMLVNERKFLRKQVGELEKQRQMILTENADRQHNESKKLSKFAIGIDIISAIPMGNVVKWLVNRF